MNSDFSQLHDLQLSPLYSLVTHLSILDSLLFFTPWFIDFRFFIVLFRMEDVGGGDITSESNK